MIRIEVEDYCHACLDFSPDVTKPERIFVGEDEYSFTDTIVRCEHRKRCSGIKRYLENQIRNEEAAG